MKNLKLTSVEHAWTLAPLNEPYVTLRTNLDGATPQTKGDIGQCVTFGFSEHFGGTIRATLFAKQVQTMVNEHAALVAVAEAAKAVSDNYTQGDFDPEPLDSALATLAAVRAGQPEGGAK